MCVIYAEKWRFKFSINKTKCMIIGENKFKDEPIWTLGENAIENVHCIDILGVKFNDNFKYRDHVDSRIQKCSHTHVLIIM